MNPSRQRCALVLCLSIFAGAAVVSAQPAWPELSSASSVSGQFIVSAASRYSPLLHSAALATNNDFIRLEPALLAVSAERFKQSLWSHLGLKPDFSWRGKIFLSLQPARSTADAVTIAATPLVQTWNYRVELPDVLLHTRYARALAGVLLLEIANRQSPVDGPAAEIPSWLTDGLAQTLLAADGVKFLLSAPEKPLDGLMQRRDDQTERGLDAYAAARRTLQNTTALTFEQLNWPDDAQANGGDGGVYFASAQLFVGELLGLKNGPARLREMLARLPGCHNWQTAFFAAFHEDFPGPRDVEKWWALRVVAFAARDPGPRWTAMFSRDQLAALLAVPVEMRSNSNSLPVPAEISLQAALRNFTAEQKTEVLTLKLRDFKLAEFRLAPPLAALAGEYAAALADFLGDQKTPPVAAASKHAGTTSRPAGLTATVKKLDVLDARRHLVETRLKLFSPPPST